DGQVRAVVVERGLEVLDRAAAGAPAELLRGVEDGRGRGDRRSGGERLRGGGARGRRGRGGGSGRRGLGRTTGECGAEDDAAEDRCAAEAARCALCVLGGELGAAGEAVGVVLGHDVRFVPSEPDLWRGMYCWLLGATGSWVVLAGDRRRRGDGTAVGAAGPPGQRAWQSPTVDLGRFLRIRPDRDQNAP